ncbi:YdeI/OmpD-associated family protein [Algivirga pacifica]|uniref:YdeI/OmpD-associated family protein n=1 Tax=Algivirga pacifica TaxID=1162670 RepID=A0ABP9D6U5_9BACT
MTSQKAIVNKEYLLKKFPGKGGWTYAEIPEISQDKSNPFGWVRVRGFIDDYELKQYKLMPMGEGKLFLPVKAAIRKNIKKEAGDIVSIQLFLDETPFLLPEEIKECLLNEPPSIYETFLSFTEGEQKAYIDWIYDAKMEDTKVSRIVEMINRLEKGLKYYDK